MTSQLRAQGCSDAGFCTLYNLKPIGEDSRSETRLNSIKSGASYGKGDHGVGAWGGYLEFDRVFGHDINVNAKLTFASQSGTATTLTGVSDLFLSVNHQWIGDANVTVALKIPMNNADKTLNGKSLPMDYQTSLGTIDLIIGAGYKLGEISIQAAIQQPRSKNKNTFLASDYPAGSEFTEFQSTNKFVRKGDVLLRVSRGFSLNDQWRITPGILPIYHLADDEFTDAGGIGVEIAGSRVLTLNGNVFIEYMIDPANAVELNFGAPFITRDARPDGLTRG